MIFRQKYVLVSDIGGTNTNLAILDEKNNILFKKDYKTKQYSGFELVLTDFFALEEVKKYPVKEVCLAVAGPINSERTLVQGTNFPWIIDTGIIKERFKFTKMLLINDFEAIGFSVDIMRQDQYVELTGFGANSTGTVAIIGAGTGLGTSIVPIQGKKHIPLAAEGGHTDLCINMKDALERKFADHLIKKKVALITENAVSGPGILNIYEFLLTQKYKHNQKLARNIKKATEKDKPKLITKYAQEEKDPLCIQTVELFVRFYARAARNLAVNTLCSEVIIAGGIAAKIMPFMQESFVEQFMQHDHIVIRKLLEQMSIIVIVDYNISLYGAANALNYTTI